MLTQQSYKQKGQQSVGNKHCQLNLENEVMYLFTQMD